ncbi:MAG: RNA 2',3'-cyclic phosphodiesterase [Caulobacteraceae bacterium]
MIRLFAALAVPDDIAAVLARRQQGLPGARWSALENLHLTLRFFGEVRETTAADLDAGLAILAMESFELSLEGVGAFGERDHMRAVWAGVAESEPLRRLAVRCDAVARRCGLEIEAKAFRPHVTLAYLRHTPEARAAAWVQDHNLLKSPPWRAGAFGLYSSWRSAEGSRYELERSYPLI